ncbi:META domain-containing protein [Methanoregula sp.]|jgi:heat shock protein HslJ|uniref:META domain-containing protein n=1 Tax=Methanoregula sp. TaxID=2052170 RepID=UPI003C138A83
MKYPLAFCTSLLLLAVLFGGCTSQAPQSTATPVATAAPQQPALTTVQVSAAAAPAITGTTWTLGWFDNNNGVWSKVAEGSTITATFGADGKVSGSSGCNQYSTVYHLGTDPKIWMQRPDVPSQVCQSPIGVMKQESAYDTDLSWAQDYSITNNQLLMFDQTGKKILQFDPS